MRHGGIGMIEEGKLKGRKFIIPAVVFVAKSETEENHEYSKACLIHQKFISDSGCRDCDLEVTARRKELSEIGL